MPKRLSDKNAWYSLKGLTYLNKPAAESRLFM